MRHSHTVWLLGLAATILIIAAPVVFFTARSAETVAPSPWDGVPAHPPHVSHASLINGTFEDGSAVTENCLSCHPNSAEQVMHTTHWTWTSKPVWDESRQQMVSFGKANALNNFCIGIQSNEKGCTKCHAGYGWSDETFDFSDQTNVDCLVCHDQSGVYRKGTAGEVAEGVDLLVAARSVGLPTSENCGSCHFNGGGGNAVKHGDLDESLYFPTRDMDVHMGGLNFQCIDCHRTQDHNITGRAMSVGLDMRENQIACTDCHDQARTHEDARINSHLETLACQTCHIPRGAVREATKMVWDWSTAGQDLPEDPHEYLKIKGSFVYEGSFVPEYAWYNGTLRSRYLFGDPLDADGVTELNPPAGSVDDPTARIWPFKVHTARQPYDVQYNYLLQPQTVGNYWVNFDWQAALVAGSQRAGLDYSGEYGFAETTMYWNLSHMVAPSANALQCADCHGSEATRMDWAALGYPGDPMQWGGREARPQASSESEDGS